MEKLFKLANLYHTIMCSEIHELESCEFYHEEELPDHWSQPSHLAWLVEAQNFQKRSGLSTEALLEKMNTIVNSFSLVFITIDNNECLKSFTKQVISLHLNP